MSTRRVAVIGAVLACLVGVSGEAPRDAGAVADPDRDWLVVFRDDVADPAAVAAELRAVVKGDVRFVYRHSVRGCALVGTAPGARERLLADARVRWVEPDRPVYALGTQVAAPWGLDRIDQADQPLNTLYNYGATGAGVRIYVLDTGVRISHNEFGNRASNGWDFVDNDAVAQDGHGHGTHVAGSAAGATYGVAKSASIVALRVLGNDGSGTTSGVVAAVDWVTSNAVKPAVANMSLSGGASPTLDSAVNGSIQSGVTYCVASGNGTAVGAIGIPLFGTATDAGLYSPGRVAAALTVGATDINDAEAVFSNYGASVDLLAPGVNITSAWNSGDGDTAILSGTSMATPHVAGAAALYLETNTTASSSTVTNAIISNATSGRISSMASTLTPNRLLYVGSFVSTAHAVGAPSAPTGPSTGTVGVNYSYTAAGSTCNQAHGVSYAFDWADGTTSAYGSATQSHAWSTAGIFDVRATAQCTAGQTSLASAPLRVTITAPGTGGPLQLSPDAGFESSGVSGGSFSPASASYTVTNAGPGSMNWSVTSSEPWLSITPASGTLSGSSATSVTVGVVSGSVPTTAGLYSATLTFNNTSTGTGSRQHTATVSVSVPPEPAPRGSSSRCGVIGVEALPFMWWALVGGRRRRRRRRGQTTAQAR